MKTIKLITKEQNQARIERITTMQVPYFGKNDAGEYIKICDNCENNPNVVIIEPGAMNPILNRKLNFSDVELSGFRSCTENEFMQAYCLASDAYERHLSSSTRISSNDTINRFLLDVKQSFSQPQQKN